MSKLYCVLQPVTIFGNMPEDIYDGECMYSAKPNGEGTKSYSNGDVYTGDWKFGQRHGQGIYKWANGGEYRGAYVDDRKHG